MDLQGAIFLSFGLISLGVIAIFVLIARRSGAPVQSQEEVQGPGYAIRRWWFLFLVAVLAVAFGLTVQYYPYGDAQAASLEGAQEYTVLAQQFAFVNLPAEIAPGPVIFHITSSDVNHGFAIYDPQQAAALAAGAPVDGQAVYVNCQACHQADGSGIPSAFPPLNGHVPELLAADGGREYLLQVVLYGIQGPITALGGDYNAVMVAWGSLGDAEVAAVANYVSTAWDNSFPDAQEPFTAADVAAQRGNPLTPTEVHAARQTLAVP